MTDQHKISRDSPHTGIQIHFLTPCNQRKFSQNNQCGRHLWSVYKAHILIIQIIKKIGELNMLNKGTYGA